jgi:hypothetical protein
MDNDNDNDNVNKDQEYPFFKWIHEYRTNIFYLEKVEQKYTCFKVSIPE